MVHHCLPSASSHVVSDRALSACFILKGQTFEAVTIATTDVALKRQKAQIIAIQSRSIQDGENFSCRSSRQFHSDSSHMK